MEQKKLEELAKIITSKSIDIPVYLRNIIIGIAKRNESLEYVKMLRDMRTVDQFSEIDFLLIKAKLMIQAISRYGKIKPMRDGLTWDSEDSFFIDNGLAQLHFLVDNGSNYGSMEMYPVTEKCQKLWEQIYF